MLNTSMAYSDDKEFIKKIGLQIRKYRLQQKMTQLDLAVKCGMEENAIQRLETGRTNPTVKTLLKLAKGLDVHLYKLFILENEDC